MSSIPLGFGDDSSLRVSKSADIEETLVFPPAYSFTGYTGQLMIRVTEDAATALVTVTTTATAAGSVIVFTGRNIVVRIKAADVRTLPNDAVNAANPWVGVYEIVLTDTASLTTRLVSGALVAEKGVVR